ncbi:LOW QUALITY PROTEIN: uncharacterized protein LOC104897326 [Beta vulgaris subsp. vulgaris]|uniref:LOW QUALITY PROTEIN: uncharacterized protein LOC104897326 n=1 Tax=Beta vulgaris subsp. vulgaris TaxID=3555 RepID=UPI002548F6DC|nr:LOW QUALITY PROTEIN: uncharacterized protein LOC104897326 [Beta vulgaris subsp. vulgaris]
MAVQNRLYTTDILQQWNIQCNRICYLCEKELESANHLFFQCEYADQVWRPLLQLLGISRRGQGFREEKIIAAAKAHSRSRKAQIYVSLITEAIYMIWLQRNQKVFSGNCLTASQTMREIVFKVAGRCDSRDRSWNDENGYKLARQLYADYSLQKEVYHSSTRSASGTSLGNHTVFVYGSLLADQVVQVVQVLLNRVPASSPAILPNFNRFSIKGRVYLAILPVENKKVLGRVLTGVTNHELDILDIFEDVEYVRNSVEVTLEDSLEKLQAYAYVWDDKDDPNLYGDWDFEQEVCKPALRRGSTAGLTEVIFWAKHPTSERQRWYQVIESIFSLPD